ERLLPDVEVLTGLRRVVAHHVDVPVLGHGVGHHGDDRGLVGHVGGAGDRPSPLGPDRCGHLFEEPGPPPGQGQVRALAGEEVRHDLAQPVTGPGDDDDLVRQPAHLPPVSVACAISAARYPSGRRGGTGRAAWHAGATMPLIANDVLACAAGTAPGRLAVTLGEDRLSFGEVETMANRFANALHGLGARPGERAAWWSETTLEGVGLYFAV